MKYFSKYSWYQDVYNYINLHTCVNSSYEWVKLPTLQADLFTQCYRCIPVELKNMRKKLYCQSENVHCRNENVKFWHCGLNEIQEEYLHFPFSCNTLLPHIDPVMHTIYFLIALYVLLMIKWCHQRKNSTALLGWEYFFYFFLDTGIYPVIFTSSEAFIVT